MKFKPTSTRGKAIASASGAVVMALVAGIIAVEGGYVNHPHDGGGATKYGITEKVARANGYTGQIIDLPRDLAEQIYERQYITAPSFDLILDRMQPVGEELVDSGVNVGTRRASCWLQESLNNLNRAEQDFRNIRVDCKIGPRTVAAINRLVDKRGEQVSCELLVKALDGKQMAHYTNLAERSYKYQSFYVGWVTHRVGNVNCKGT